MTSLAEYNNNPGNLKPKGFTYEGQIGVDDNGLAIFENKVAGKNALIQDIQIKQKRGLNNPNDFIDTYTPASKENPEEGRDNYKMGLAGHLGLNSTKDPFPAGSEQKIADYISSFESGAPAKANPNNPASFTQKPVASDFEPDEPKPATGEDTSLLDKVGTGANYVLGKAAENENILALGAAGAAKGYLEKNLLDPASIVKEGGTTPAVIDALKRKASEASTKLENVIEEANYRQANGQDIGQLRQDAQRLNMENRAAQQELQAAQNELKALPKAYEPPPAPAALPSEAPVAQTRTGPASGPKIADDSSARNWTIKEAGQKHQMPEAVLDAVTDKTGTSKTGGMSLIREDLRNLEKIKQIGGGSYGLTESASGQIMAPPDVLAERAQQAAKLEQELAAKQAQQAAEQAIRNQAEQTKRIAAEANFKSQREAAQRRVDLARENKMNVGPQNTDARNAVRDAQTQAQQDAQRISNARVSANTAQQIAREAAEANPSNLKTAMQEFGRRSAQKLPMIGNTLAAAGAGLSVDEARERYKKGDYSGAVMGALEAGLNAASMTPPVNPAALLAKGVGTAGSLAMLPAWLIHDFVFKRGAFEPKKAPQKARGGLTLMR